MKTIHMRYSFSCAALLCACGSSSASPEDRVDLLKTSAEHYGQTYAEWAAAWVDYIYRYAPPDCTDPVNDVSGESCELYQDPASPVFFLVGTYGGTARRTECPVPGDKALFIPIVNAWGDNAGLPPDQVLSDAEVKANVESAVGSIAADTLHLAVDGEAIDELDRGKISSAPYILHLPAEPNSYTCQHISGVEGDFRGYVGGYFAMLPPLGSGEHRISFGGTFGDAAHGGAIIDIQYEFAAP